MKALQQPGAKAGNFLRILCALSLVTGNTFFASATAGSKAPPPPPKITAKFNKAAQNPKLTPKFNKAAQNPKLTPTFNKAAQNPKLTPTFNKAAQNPKLTPKFNTAAKPPSAIVKTNRAQGLPARAKIASSSLSSPTKGLKVPQKAASKLNASAKKVGKSLAPKSSSTSQQARQKLQKRDQPTPGLHPKSSSGLRKYQAQDTHQKHVDAYKDKPKALPGKKNISQRMRQPDKLPKGTLPSNQRGHLKKEFDKVKDSK